MATLSKLELEDSSQRLFVLSEYQHNAVSVQVSDGEGAWEGSLSAAELKALAEQSKMTQDRYIKYTVKALSRENLGELSFLYSAKHVDNNKLELTWKKHILTDNIKFQLGQIELYPCSSSHIVSALLNLAIDSIGDLQQNVALLKAKSVRLTREREKALQDLGQHASLQEQVEKDLFTKFKVVLNEKKAKIRNLMECKEHLTEQNEDLRQKLWTSNSSTNLPTAPEDSMSEVEGQPDMPTRAPATSSTAATTTSSSTSSGGVTSLLGDVLCRAPSPPPSKRRHTTRPHKSLADLPRPLAMDVSRCAKKKPNISHNAEELDSDKLLDML